VRLRPLPGWRIATALEGGADSTYRAADYDTLADSPIVMGQLDEVVFDVLGRPHQLTIWPEGRVADRDVAKLVVDIKAVVRALAGLFDGTLPYERYAFLLHMSARGRGGLEHGDCATLLANPHAFATRAGYLDLLSLIAHETLHAWNVKRIRPEGLTPYRYQEENYTRLLWWFEGATSYFDWLTVRHARLCTVDEYLDHLATEIVQLEATPGRLVQSLEDSSFEAWIKLYRPDENSANSGVSYYRKGEVVCALLDLELRARTQERVSLQSVLAYLWKAHGAKGLPVPERGMQEIFERVSGVPMGDRFDAWIRTPGPLDVRDSFYRVGLRFERQGEAADGSKQGVKASLGLKVRTDAGRTFVSSVVRGGAGQKGGVDTGDELIAVDGRRIEPGAIDQAMWGCEPGRDVELLVSHEGRIALRRVTLDEARAERAKLVVRPDATPAERARFAAWLGDEHPAWATKRS
jgi:predicted metalloprotease with PDZ domain